MPFHKGRPDFEGARAGTNEHQDHINRTMWDMLLELQKKTQIQATSADKQAPVAVAPPQRAGLSVLAVPGSGRFRVSITNPEFNSPKVLGNQSRSPLYHKLEMSSTADFTRDIEELPLTQQTYFEFNPGSSTLHFRLTSSHDGVNFSKPTLSGPVIG